MSYHHREHVSKMRCIFKDMLNGTMQNLDRQGVTLKKPSSTIDYCLENI